MNCHETPDRDFWNNRRVLITGHTGFKGSWLSLWLQQWGAEILGISLEPELEDDMFNQLNLESCIHHQILDIRNTLSLQSAVQDFKPEIIFHLAAQPLVRKSYAFPQETWDINVMGTISLLESIRLADLDCTVLVVSTDKVYANPEWDFGFREVDPLGGYDPYSSSKSAVELAVDCWRQSYFNCSDSSPVVKLLSARAGNVIGGGDWSEDRIVPDVVRAVSSGSNIQIRNPGATRPWQHVLDPLCGYISLVQYAHKSIDSNFLGAYNFGPKIESNRSVMDLVEHIYGYWSAEISAQITSSSLHEATNLFLSTDKIYNLIGWRPLWNFENTVSYTVHWYKRYLTKSSPSMMQPCMI